MISHGYCRLSKLYVSISLLVTSASACIILAEPLNACWALSRSVSSAVISVFDASKDPAFIFPKPKSFPAPIVASPDSGVATKIFGNFDLSGSYTKSVLDFDRDAYPDFDTNWNTPDDKFKAQFGNTSLFRNFGFNVKIP